MTFPATQTRVLAERNYIILQSTTSAQNSGLLNYLIPKFRSKTGVGVRVVAVGTGQALKNGRNGDADLILVHARAAEERFVDLGFGIERHDVMRNDFVLIGPKSDPAGVAAMSSVSDAFSVIAKRKISFVSRGDDSGTHIRERSLWKMAGLDPGLDSGGWYREVGSGMGATLNVAVSLGAYTLTDRATWASFSNKNDFDVLLKGDERLVNRYGVILINPAKHRHVNVIGARAFIHWLTGTEGQSAIGAFRLDGLKVFHPIAQR
ncbi:MAG: Tungstate-binding protein TupA [Alphaproteobacteria bacterium MarineAlpha11_Bin1]|nr:MAG: Tungstate-binding protein TupA [Alphaproteobacteria bacterium MarineAlpha11_Bin1]|tara:strand:+ start:6871 stop:7659 length:789 start_codon:yes stop_codon:yes gene_type:complete